MHIQRQKQISDTETETRYLVIDPDYRLVKSGQVLSGLNRCCCCIVFVLQAEKRARISNCDILMVQKVIPLIFREIDVAYQLFT